MRPRTRSSTLIACLILFTGCAFHREVKTNALEFLYPEGAEATPPTDIALQLPVRVGVAFAPEQGKTHPTVSEAQKQGLLNHIAESFREREGIEAVEVIPSTFLSPRGGFENVDRLVPAFGLDLIAIVSYDQFQFSESGRSQWAYWTLVGAYVVKGEKNETRTIMNTVVFDIPARAMLFNATGQSNVKGKSLPVQIEKAMRERSEQGFAEATDDLIVKLEEALDEFERHAAAGTVRGPGTTAITMTDASGQPVSGGAGSLSPVVALGALVLFGIAVLGRRFGSIR